MKFGNKLKALRLENHMTQSVLAEKLGISLRTLQNYESGNIYPKQTQIYARIAALFGVSTNYLLTEQAPSPAVNFTEQAQQLVDQVGSLFSGGALSEEDKDKVLCTINNLYWQAKRNNQKKKESDHDA